MHNDNKNSKIRNNPVRTIVIEDDNRPGSYPTHIPPGSTLVDPIYFDDTDTIETPSAYSQARFKIVNRNIDNLTLRISSLLTIFPNIDITFSTSPPADSAPQFYIDISDLRTSSEILLGTPISVDEKDYITRVSKKLVEKINDTPYPVAAIVDDNSVVTVTFQVPGSVSGEVYPFVDPPSLSPIATPTGTRLGILNRLDFDLGSDSNIYAPLGVNLDNARTQGLVERQYILPAVLTGSIQVPTSGDARLLEVYSKGHPVYKGPNSIAPYNEDNAGQAFGFGGRANDLRYGTDASGGSEFMLRGSTSGSLDESLANKDKIVIDLEPVEKTTIQFDAEKTTSDNYPMMYFNHELKKWEPIGLNQTITTVAVTDLDDELDRTMIGFGQSYSNFMDTSANAEVEVYDERLASLFTGQKRVFQETSWSPPIDTFGFPQHPKFAATGSQALEVESLINEPFLVEKIVYEFSGSISGEWFVPARPLNSITSFGSGRELNFGGSTFFILNQRKANPQRKDIDVYGSRTSAPGNPKAPGFRSEPTDQDRKIYDMGGPPSERQLSVGGPSVYVDSTREILTFSRVGVIPSDYDDVVVGEIEDGFPHPADFMALGIESPPTTTPINFIDGKYIISDTVKNSAAAPAVSAYAVASTGKPAVPGLSPDEVYLARVNSQDNPTGRAYRAEFGAQELGYSCLPVGAGTPYASPARVYAPTKDTFESPYLIRPGDRLVFGWQSQISYSYDQPPPNFTIASGAGKLILYGSYLQDDKPVHDIYKDQLSSDAAHEAIPAGPWVLDRFEAEPSMVYTGSMRAQLVTGTMVTQGSGDSLSVTDPDDLSVGGVRAVAATSYDGNLGQRGSFYRNLRLVDSEEQYYDSMQPNPYTLLFENGARAVSGTFSNIGASPPANWQNSIPGQFIPIMFPGEVYNGPPHPSDPVKPLGIQFWWPDLFPEWVAAMNQYANKELIGSFVYSKYSNIPRVKRINKSLLSGDYPIFTTPLLNGGPGPNTPGSVVFSPGAGSQYFLTDLSYVGTFPAELVGKEILVYNATSPGNNGTFTIDAVAGAAIEYTNAAGVAGADANALFYIPYFEVPGTIQTYTGKLSSAIFFVTGTTPTGGVSNFQAKYGLSKHPPDTTPNFYNYEYIYPTTDVSVDTNPILPERFVGLDDREVDFELSRFMGCFGSGPLGLVRYQKQLTSLSITSFPRSTVQGAEYRGAKYGLINPTPLFSTAIYNGTSFGQPRDLMEPRKYTRYSLGDNTLTDSAVQVLFVDNTVVELTDGARNNVTSGSATNSINISPFCTSSIPFVDGQVNDRSLPLPEDLLRL